MNTAAPRARSASPGLIRRLPVGAEPQPGGGVHFRIWAPASQTLAIELEGQAPCELAPEPGGYHSGLVDGARAGSRFRVRLAGRDGALPDPASRFQPDGPHGPSEVVDPAAFVWSDRDW